MFEKEREGKMQSRRKYVADLPHPLYYDILHFCTNIKNNNKERLYINHKSKLGEIQEENILISIMNLGNSSQCFKGLHSLIYVIFTSKFLFEKKKEKKRR
jgi:hypothetical protein